MEQFFQFHKNKGNELNGDVLEPYVPNDKNFLYGVLPQESADALDDRQLFGDYFVLEAAARYMEDSFDRGIDPDTVKDNLIESNAVGNKLLACSLEDIGDYFVRRASTTDVDGIGKIDLLNKHNLASQEFRQRFLEETGYEMLPHGPELEALAIQRTDGNYKHGIHELDGGDVESNVESTQRAEDYVEFVQDLYDDLWGAAPRGRGIGGGGLAENRLDLIEKESSIKAFPLKQVRKVAPDLVDGFLYSQLMSEVESGTKIMMRPTQQYSPSIRTFAHYGAEDVNQKEGVIIRDDSTDNILSSGLVGTGNPYEIEDISPQMIDFEPDRIERASQFNPIEYAKWAEEKIN